ncbi:MAG TPA: XRE family transcriptional regulator [Thermoanaerobaculaceae bacterium]|nr:XRE family transcriptional regulator [Thermoanaerobaculaceae bacterium]HPS79912.1 XRE family transcriptional regulator [Thermoanaerobaculaceae bacterium]
MVDWEKLATRLRESAQGWAQKDLAAEVHLAQPTISQYLKGTKRPSLESVLAFARVLDVPVDYLLGRVETPDSEPEPPVDESSFFTVPLLRDRTAAGQPRLVGAEVAAELPFTRYWLRKRLGVIPRPGRLVLIRVDKGWLGESMLPTIAPGSMLLIDRGPGSEGPTAVEDGRVYLLSFDDGLTVKRVYRIDDHLVACPDNTTGEHRPFVIELKGKRLQDVVKGRVIWVANQDV